MAKTKRVNSRRTQKWQIVKFKEECHMKYEQLIEIGKKFAAVPSTLR